MFCIRECLQSAILVLFRVLPLTWSYVLIILVISYWLYLRVLSLAWSFLMSFLHSFIFPFCCKYFVIILIIYHWIVFRVLSLARSFLMTSCFVVNVFVDYFSYLPLSLVLSTALNLELYDDFLFCCEHFANYFSSSPLRLVFWILSLNWSFLVTSYFVVSILLII